MGFCIDKSTRFLRALGYNVVRHPGEGLGPLDLIGWDHRSPARLGRIEQLMVTSNGPAPRIEPGLSAADIDGKTTSKLPVSVGIDIFGSAIRALGGDLGVTARYREAQLLEFSYHSVQRDRTNPLELGKFLRDNDVDWSNPVLERYLLGKGRLYVVLEVMKSNEFGLTAFDRSKAEITLDAPGLQQLVGSEIEVAYEGSSRVKVIYKGKRRLVFGFKCAELAAIDDPETGELRLTYKPVKDGAVFFSLGDADEIPDFSTLTENGLIDEIAGDGEAGAPASNR